MNTGWLFSWPWILIKFVQGDQKRIYIYVYAYIFRYQICDLSILGHLTGTYYNLVFFYALSYLQTHNQWWKENKRKLVGLAVLNTLSKWLSNVWLECQENLPAPYLEYIRIHIVVQGVLLLWWYEDIKCLKIRKGERRGKQSNKTNKRIFLSHLQHLSHVKIPFFKTIIST